MSASYTKPVAAISACFCLERLYVVPRAPYYRIESEARIAKSQKRLNRGAINRQIGRLLQRNQRAAARFPIELKEADTPAGCALAVSIQDSFDQWAALSEGAYVLRSNVTQWSDEKLIRAGGFNVISSQSHGYVEAPVGAYMLTWIERGADVLLQDGCIAKETSDALKAEAQRRSAEMTWFGHIAFASVIARKPARLHDEHV